MRYYGFPQYVPVAEKRAKAEKKIKQLRKKNPDLQPIVLEGQTLARTWWGKAWNKNLESYADYDNRIGRGRSYVRNLAVADLRIEPGRVEALVLGSSPYQVAISIKAIKTNNWQSIKTACLGRLSSLPELLAGKFPKALGELLMQQGEGIFPSPDEISFSCSCPDWASMCKHVAATLYGIGARLDENPSLFFTLRQVDMEELVAQAVHDKTAAILGTGSAATGAVNVIAETQIEDLFGIALDDIGDLEYSGVAPSAQQSPGKSNSGRPPASGKEGPTKSARPEQQTQIRLPSDPTDLVRHFIELATDGITVQELREATGFPAARLYPILARLKKQGLARNPGYGRYCRP